jgi:inner membrane transporter RhtA
MSRPGAFGVFMSLGPAITVLVGWVVLRQMLELRALIALVLVTTAAVGATRWSAHIRTREDTP